MSLRASLVQLLLLGTLVAPGTAVAEDPALAAPEAARLDPAAQPSLAPDHGDRPTSEADAAGLRNDAWRAAGITAGTLILDSLMRSNWSTTACKICDSTQLDEWARGALAWSDPESAAQASDVLAKVAIPLLAVGDAIRSTRSWGNAGRDVLVLAEAVAITSLCTDLAKFGFARSRPGQPPTGAGSAAYHSLWSGHTALAFTVVVAQAMQDTIRGDESAPWVWAIGLTLASAVGYLRVAGDAHWLTDVVVGAAAGTIVGVAVPLWEKRLVRGVTISPAPGGIAVRF